MTRKDYQLIAKVLADAPDTGTVEGLFNWGTTCRRMARELAQDNPRFNTVTFLEACGFDEAFGYPWRNGLAA